MKFAKGESEEEVAQWAGDIEHELSIVWTNWHKSLIKSIFVTREQKRWSNIKSIWSLNKNWSNKIPQLKKQSQTKRTIKTSTSLRITKFNGKVEQWLPFWGKFTSEIGSTDMPRGSRNACSNRNRRPTLYKQRIRNSEGNHGGRPNHRSNEFLRAIRRR